MRWWLALLLWAGFAQAGCAQPVDIRVGDHGSFGRVVLSLPQAVSLADSPQGRREGDRLILDLPGAGAVAPALGLTVRRVLGVQGGHDQLALVLAPGSTTRIWRMGRRIVVDVFAAADKAGVLASPVAALNAAVTPPPVVAGAVPRPAPSVLAAPAARIAGQPMAGQAITGKALDQARDRPPDSATRLAATQAAKLPPSQATPHPPLAEPPPPPLESAGVAEDGSAPAPLEGAEALRALRLPGPGDAILLPFDSKVGAAAFAAGGMAHAVFDESKAIDLAALKDDPVFASARITLAAGSTHLTMALPPRARLSLARREEGWALSVRDTASGRRAAPVRLHGDELRIAMKQAANVVVLSDPQTGARLLVGTVHDTGGGGEEGGEGVVVGHVSPEFRLLPSWEGVAVGVVSDRLALTATRDGFSLDEASGPRLSTLMADDAQAALESAGTLTRRFAIPALGLAALRQRLSGDISAAAHAPVRARFRPRLAAAQDMIGLGMAREAAALLDVARRDEPAEEGRADAAALLAMARWLESGPAGRVAGDEAIDAPGLGASDEVALWRALMPPRQVAQPVAARAAAVAADWRLLTAYPATLRRRLVPQAAAILIDGNAPAAAAALLDASPDLPLEAERARLLAGSGKLSGALVLLDRLARGQDRKQAAYALRDATELRLSARQTSPLAAAQALDKQIYAWRDPDFELARRLRVASLQTQAGQFRHALAGLREADGLFAQEHDRVHEAETQTIATLLRPDAEAALTPIDLVALVQDNADLLGQGEVAKSLTPVLVDKLAALDLPERADRLVAKLIESTADAVPKALLGARLAGLRLDQNDPAGALAALDQTMGDALPAEVEGRRAVTRARALAELGEDGPALSLLAAHDGAESWEMQAQLREKSHDWHGADAALSKLVGASVPASGALSAAQQDMILRLASAASQAGDQATLQALAAGPARRLSPGPRASLFEALTVQPVREVADLPRAQREAAQAATLPAAWAGYAAH